jgi:hypothetical protein
MDEVRAESEDVVGQVVEARGGSVGTEGVPLAETWVMHQSPQEGDKREEESTVHVSKSHSQESCQWDLLPPAALMEPMLAALATPTGSEHTKAATEAETVATAPSEVAEYSIIHSLMEDALAVAAADTMSGRPQEDASARSSLRSDVLWSPSALDENISFCSHSLNMMASRGVDQKLPATSSKSSSVCSAAIDVAMEVTSIMVSSMDGSSIQNPAQVHGQFPPVRNDNFAAPVAAYLGVRLAQIAAKVEAREKQMGSTSTSLRQSDGGFCESGHSASTGSRVLSRSQPPEPSPSSGSLLSVRSAGSGGIPATSQSYPGHLLDREALSSSPPPERGQSMIDASDQHKRTARGGIGLLRKVKNAVAITSSFSSAKRLFSRPSRRSEAIL